MDRVYEWTFPLEHTHTGMLLGNGTLGAMLWGGGRRLCITLGHADLWDHRGGMPWSEDQSYANIRRCLEANDEKGLRRLFEHTAGKGKQPRRPSVIPIGHIEIDLGARAALERGFLHIDQGRIELRVRTGSGVRRLRLTMDMDAPVLALAHPRAWGPLRVTRVPAWKTLEAELEAIGFAPPSRFSHQGLAGWVQPLPADPAVCVACQQTGTGLLVTAVRGRTRGEDPRPLARALLDRTGGFRSIQRRAQAWWRAYWLTVPDLQIPAPNLQFLYEYGMYKFGSFTNPAGPAATLQGPWIEDTRMPPWSSDYHFNINVQLCYRPAFHGNRLENLRPLFAMIEGWQDVLQHNARVFFGIDDGVMLPHAVDDRGTCMGGFWTGSIDHGCTAWVALMMYRYARYTMDDAFLARTAYPFMTGAMRVYEELLERKGRAFRLPVSVSPEYRGAALNAWGANASFQLACIHALVRALLDASRWLKRRPRPIWRKIRENLPRAALIGPKGRERIALWEGTDLEESHRHHSHLAGITPLATLPLDDPFWRGVVERSLAHWIFRGPGLWSGWCVPWASAIHTRLGNGQMAALLLDIWQRIFTNHGHGTLHDAEHPGFTLMGIGATAHQKRGREEIMQMDAGMGAITAISDMLLYEQNGVHHVFGGVPPAWREAAFGPMRTDGAFLVSGRLRNGRVHRVDVTSPCGGTFNLRNPWAGRVRVEGATRRSRRAQGTVLRIPTQPGETLRIHPDRGRA